MRRVATVAAAAVAAMALAGVVCAQAAPARFAAASIKPAAPGGQLVWRTDPQRLTAENMSLFELIRTSCQLRLYQITGPDWLSKERFSITATTSAPVNDDAMMGLLWRYLIDQFDLKTHREQPLRTVYELHVAAGGLKMAPVSGALPAGVRAGNFHISVKPEGLELSGVGSVAQLSGVLNVALDEPSLDKTGLSGVYKIDLTFSTPTDTVTMGRLFYNTQLGGKEMHFTAPSIFKALSEQLGLKLEKTKAPMTMLVIDAANREPRGN